ncbi:sushivon Willebrand factor type AEGF and pentraxin domain-containing protein 1-like protein, partial [Aphelenchoides avenae]
ATDSASSKSSAKASASSNTTQTTTSPTCQLFSIDRATSQFASTVTGTSFKVGETVVVNCRTGYQFADNSPSRIYECTIKGSWVEDPEASKCLPLTTTSTSTVATTTSPGCDVFSINTTVSQFNGNVTVGSPVKAGDTVTVLCKTNYVFSDKSSTRIYQCMNNGSWVEDPTKDSCRPARCPAPNVSLSNSQRPPTDVNQAAQPIGAQIIHTCRPSYVFSESFAPTNIYECQSNGMWTENLYAGEACVSAE